MTQDEAISLYESRFWESLSFRDRAKFQLFEERLCMPFDVFHEAIQKSLGRPVYTHEFTSSNQARLQREFLGEEFAPTLDDIIALLPADKRIVIVGP